MGDTRLFIDNIAPEAHLLQAQSDPKIFDFSCLVIHKANTVKHQKQSFKI